MFAPRVDGRHLRFVRVVAETRWRRSTLGVLVYKALYGVFAARSYWPYVAVLIVVILAVAHMTWRLLLRIGVVPAYATAVAALTMIAIVPVWLAQRIGGDPAGTRV